MTRASTTRMSITYTDSAIHVVTRGGFGLTLAPSTDPRLTRISGRTFMCRTIDAASAVASELRSWGVPVRQAGVLCAVG